MRLTIAGRHMEMTDALKSHVEKYLEKLRGHFDRVIDADVVLSVEKHRHIAEITLHANGFRIHGRESSDDMYASVDSVIDKLDKQIRKHKDRLGQHQSRKAAELREFRPETVELKEFAPSESRATAAVQPHVIRREKLSMKPMTVEEAARRIDLMEEDFVVFSNAETQQVNVLYAREDGTYGLIEPQY
ncbi:MAG: ribosome-associated translation inhibitor RaiA [Candidatus Hydrogenedentes bacterium]|nr:ribosome-associated translation inhibitor RaiA [Candidatus Hydrogenedentota bacterium]